MSSTANEGDTENSKRVLSASAVMSRASSASVRTPLTGAALVMEMCGGFHLAPAVLLAAFAAAFTANALHSTPVYDSLKERILEQRRRRRAAASPTEERP